MAQTQTELDVHFINEERAADAREAYGDWRYEYEREERDLDVPHERRLNRNVPVCDTCHRDLWDCCGTDRCIDCGTLQVIGDEGREECPMCKEQQP